MWIACTGLFVLFTSAALILDYTKPLRIRLCIKKLDKEITWRKDFVEQIRVEYDQKNTFVKEIGQKHF